MGRIIRGQRCVHSPGFVCLGDISKVLLAALLFSNVGSSSASLRAAGRELSQRGGVLASTADTPAGEQQVCASAVCLSLARTLSIGDRKGLASTGLQSNLSWFKPMLCAAMASVLCLLSHWFPFRNTGTLLERERASCRSCCFLQSRHRHPLEEAYQRA